MRIPLVNMSDVAVSSWGLLSVSKVPDIRHFCTVVMGHLEHNCVTNDKLTLCYNLGYFTQSLDDVHHHGINRRHLAELVTDGGIHNVTVKQVNWLTYSDKLYNRKSSSHFNIPTYNVYGRNLTSVNLEVNVHVHNYKVRWPTRIPFQNFEINYRHDPLGKSGHIATGMSTGHWDFPCAFVTCTEEPLHRSFSHSLNYMYFKHFHCALLKWFDNHDLPYQGFVWGCFFKKFA